METVTGWSMMLHRVRWTIVIALASQLVACSSEVPTDGSVAGANGDRTTEKADDRASPSTNLNGQSAKKDAATSSKIQRDPMEPQDSKYLKTESKFISGGGISTYEADQILGSHDRFRKALEEMDRDAMRSTEAQDISRHLRKPLEEAVGQGAAITAFSCGFTVCMGTIQVASAAEHERWVMSFLRDPSFRKFGFLDVAEKVGNVYESRFMFSTDPDVGGINIPN